MKNTKTPIRLGLLLLLFAVTAIDASAQSVASLVEQGEKMKEQHREADALAVYKQVLSKDPNHLKALLNASFLSAREGFRATGDRKKQLYNDSYNYAKKGLAIAPNSADANFVMALAMGRIAEISPTKEKIEASIDIKKYSEAALKLDKTHAGAWHLLGRWHHGVMELGSTKMFLIKTVYGGMPKASYETAIACYNKAVTYSPEYILYYLDLAKTYLALEQKDNAKATLTKALTLKPKQIDDPQYLKECRELLSEL